MAFGRIEYGHLRESDSPGFSTSFFRGFSDSGGFPVFVGCNFSRDSTMGSFLDRDLRLGIPKFRTITVNEGHPGTVKWVRFDFKRVDIFLLV